MRPTFGRQKLINLLCIRAFDKALIFYLVLVKYEQYKRPILKTFTFIIDI